MDEQIRLSQFVQRGTKCAQQLLRKIADKSNGIGDDNFPVSGKSKSPAGCIQGLKHPVLRGDVAFRQHVEERRLPGIGISDQRKDR